MSPSENETAGEAVTVGAAIRRARRRRGWSQQRVIHEIQVVARAKSMPVATARSLKAMLSRWERDHRLPDRHNQILLCAALGVAPSDLGMPHDPDSY
jgi:transcriptional regulator with XRE-family HTH domain